MTTNTPNGYPYPVGSEMVRDGDNAIRALAEAADVKVPLRALGTGASVWGDAYSATKPLRTVHFNQVVTSNQYGQIFLPYSLNTVFGCFITAITGAIVFDLDGTNPPTKTGVIFRMWSTAATPALLPNRAQGVTAVVFGL